MSTPNPTQWPSFNNLSVSYATNCTTKLRHLEAVSILIQRWWRCIHDSSTMLHPIVLDGRAYSVWNAVSYLERDQILDEQVCLYEKLDGTNLGVRCDGARFGRRVAITGKYYSKCMLDGIVPGSNEVLCIKAKIATLVSMRLPELYLYGELLFQDKFDYRERSLSKKWCCFGAMFGSPTNETKTYSTELVERLQSVGFYAIISPDNGKIKISMNTKFEALLQEANIPVAPFGGSGPLKLVCMSRHANMMRNASEGFVVSNANFMFKWKTGNEDQSKGPDMLHDVLRMPKTTLKLAGIDAEFVHFLYSIASNKVATPPPKQKPKETRKTFTNDELKIAMYSALTKYDSLEAYFARDERLDIAKNLRRELVEDLNAATKLELRCVQDYVNKVVGSAFGKWSAQQN